MSPKKNGGKTMGPKQGKAEVYLQKHVDPFISSMGLMLFCCKNGEFVSCDGPSKKIGSNLPCLLSVQR